LFAGGMLVLCVKSMDEGGYQILRQVVVVNCFLFEFYSQRELFLQKNVVYWIWFLSEEVSDSLNRCFVANEA
jgi:hypothetical protein